MKKIFKEDGAERVTFCAGRNEQIQEWLGNVPLDHAMKYAIYTENDRVFGKAVSFPCEIVD